MYTTYVHPTTDRNKKFKSLPCFITVLTHFSMFSHHFEALLTISIPLSCTSSKYF